MVGGDDALATICSRASSVMLERSITQLGCFEGRRTGLV